MLRAPAELIQHIVDYMLHNAGRALSGVGRVFGFPSPHQQA